MSEVAILKSKLNLKWIGILMFIALAFIGIMFFISKKAKPITPF